MIHKGFYVQVNTKAVSYKIAPLNLTGWYFTEFCIFGCTVCLVAFIGAMVSTVALQPEPGNIEVARGVTMRLTD